MAYDCFYLGMLVPGGSYFLSKLSAVLPASKYDVTQWRVQQGTIPMQSPPSRLLR